MSDTIGVTVIGGYLGAGKTTLVNHILRSATERIVVLVNDFGSINIDADLIESADGDTISLTNGCICCSITDGFATALEDVRQLDPPPARVVIETSGVADPAIVAGYGHGAGLRLDAVIVVADMESVEAKSRDRYIGDTVTRQLAAADILVANKADLIDGTDRRRTKRWLRSQAPGAAIVDAVQGEVPTDLLFDAESGTHPVIGADASAADATFETWSWSEPGPVSQAKLEALMADLPDTVVRLKGIVSAPDNIGAGVESLVVQRVGPRWSITPSPKPVGLSQLVAIGLSGAIDQAWLAEHLRFCDKPA